MNAPLKITFNKCSLLQSVSNLQTATFLESFNALSSHWLTTKFYHINEILPSYHGIEYIDFITKEDIISLANDSSHSIEILCNALQVIVHGVVTKNIIQPNLQILYNIKQGTIHITYTLTQTYS